MKHLKPSQYSELVEVNSCSQLDELAQQSENATDNVTEHLLETKTIPNPSIVPYPKRVFLVLGYEFCERFTYYGIKAILALYAKNKLGYTENGATLLYHSYCVMVNFMCIIGGIISDVWLGRFKTILVLSLVYVFGSAIVSISSIPVLDLSPKLMLLIGLFCIALGAGGNKPCVSAFGGDQFKLPEQSAQVATYFSLFYISINSGSLLSFTTTPILRSEFHCFGQNECFPLAFGVPVILMIVAVVCFLSGTFSYSHKKVSSENMIVQVMQCLTHAVKTRMRVGRNELCKNLLDYSIPKYGEEMVEDTRILLKIFVLYLPLPFYWTLFDQQGSRWTFQANRMNGHIGFYTIPPDQMQTINSFLVVALVPVFDIFVYPLLSKIGIRSTLHKMACGGFLAAFAFLCSAAVEFAIMASPEKSISMLWLIPQYITIAIGDVMFTVSGYAFSYEQAPERMKSVVQAMWLSTVAFGNLFILVIVKLSFFESQANEVLLFAAIMFIDMIVFIVLAKQFVTKKK